MYSPQIIDRRIAAYERAENFRLREVPVERVRGIVTYLEGRVNSKGDLVRPPLTPELSAFIQNERAMCKANFLYFATRYVHIESRIGHGGIEVFKPLESQLMLLEKMARDEAEQWERKDLGDTKFDGLCYIIHKARQLGYTTFCQIALLHRDLFYSDFKNITASVDDQKTQDTHGKWDLAYNRLPYWLQTAIVAKEKDRGKWLANGSYCALQDFSQMGGLGQGMTWSGVHLTELAAVDDAYCKEQVQNHFLPSLADTIRTLGFMESTAQGAGNWWHVTWEQVDAGRFGRWRPCFVPCYAEPQRWSVPYVPEGWEPDDDTKAYAQQIELTSPKYMNGRTVRATKEHLFWWERERKVAIETGTLNLFLANYCATPEESFQHASGGAFNSLIITQLDKRIDVNPIAYELVSTAQQRQAVRERINNDPDAPRIMSAGKFDLVPVHTTPRDVIDPRGLILLFEPPRHDINYSLGVDPAGGIVGWLRQFRNDTDEELRRDNAVASGWYFDPQKQLYVQAYEFAGPIAPREFAEYIYALGKVYCGAAGPDRGAQAIIELNNGGVEVQNRLINDFQYYSLWQRTNFNGVEEKHLNQWGWQSTIKTVPHLWVAGKDLIEQPSLPVRPRSRYLIKEMGYARWDEVRMRGEALSGKHDDRVSAMLFALWQLRGYQGSDSYAQTRRNVADKAKRLDLSFAQMDIAGADEYAATLDEWYNKVLYG